VADKSDQPSGLPPVPEGYQNISEEDQKKAKVFFDRGVAVAGTGNWEYAVEMFVQGLSIDADSVEAHKQLRDISMKRKASGGKSMGYFEAMKLKRPTKEDKQNMLNNEKLLAYDPGETSYMIGMLQNAFRAGFFDSALWIGPILQKAIADSAKPDANKFIILKDVYKGLGQWKLATDACHHAAAMRPDDMDLQTELKHLAAQDTMNRGNYNTGKSFRDSIKDMAGQKKLMVTDSDVRTSDQMSGVIADAKAEYEANPEIPGKITKYVEALVKTDKPDFENMAIDVLQKAYDETKQFRYRLGIGQIVIRQLSRTERTMRAQVIANPNDKGLNADYRVFAREKAEKELEEYLLWAENYPTELKYKFDAARRLFDLSRYGEAIPIFQDARRDPKFKVEASVYLGRAFLEAGFADEAVDTLKVVIDEYQLRGDTRSIDMTYWYARALEAKPDIPAALKQYSQVAQWNFTFRDVQARIKRLKAAAPPAAPSV
jgi:tetratricopeptide (TPR) repeat protein